MSNPSAAARAVAWLESLSPAHREQFSKNFAASLARDGLAVFHASDETWVPIPPVLSPEVLDAELMQRLCTDAHLLLRATAKLAAWTLGEGGDVGRRLYFGFTPLEHQVLSQGPARLSQVATARVDYFLDADGTPRALELNATIPAMQGYTDLIAHGWIRAVAHERGMDVRGIERLVEQAGSNAGDLLASVVAHYHLRGGKVERPKILIVSRRGDAQLGELKHYERAWTAAGNAAMHAWVDEVEVVNGRPSARGQSFDLIYRHIFARRVEPWSLFGRLLVDPGEIIVINPVVSPLEVKGMLALLHESIGEPARASAWGLDDDERAAVARVVPWTRLLDAGPSTLADGTRVDDLAAWVVAHPERVVLKRSWDYGGKSVVLGPELDDDGTKARMRETLGTGEWPAFVAAAARDPHVWVVQAFVPPTPRRHLLVEPTGAHWRDLYVDVSAYCNLGDAPRPTGGACRASGSRIVNILGGGGLTPLLRADIVDALVP